MTLGFYNIYLGVILFFLLVKIVSFKKHDTIKKVSQKPKINKSESIFYSLWLGSYYGFILCSFFIAFKFGSFFIFGFIVSIVALFLHLFSIYNYLQTPIKSFTKNGIYKISRHPGYFSTFLYFLGLSLLGESIVLVLFSIVFFITYQFVGSYEERMCESLYKKEYIEYKNKTAKNFLFF